MKGTLSRHIRERRYCMETASKAPVGHFNLLYFASASTFTSRDSEALPAPLPLSRLFETLEDKYEGITSQVLQSCLITINLEYVDLSGTSTDGVPIVLKEGDEVAIIPPVSSG